MVVEKNKARLGFLMKVQPRWHLSVHVSLTFVGCTFMRKPRRALFYSLVDICLYDKCQRDMYRLLQLERHWIPSSNLNLIGFFSTERGKET